MPADRTICVVDDDDGARDGVVFLLRSWGYSVSAFASPLEALARISALPRGCVITDVRMPGMTGIELLKALTDRGIDWPTIVVTGHGDALVAVDAMKAGAVDLLEKPYSQEALLAAVEQALASPSEREAAWQLERGRLTALLETLTPSERDVLDGLTAGWSSNAIATGLGFTSRAVEILRASVISKMAATSVAHLVRMVFRLAEKPSSNQ